MQLLWLFFCDAFKSKFVQKIVVLHHVFKDGASICHDYWSYYQLSFPVSFVLLQVYVVALGLSECLEVKLTYTVDLPRGGKKQQNERKYILQRISIYLLYRFGRPDCILCMGQQWCRVTLQSLYQPHTQAVHRRNVNEWPGYEAKHLHVGLPFF